MPYLRLTADRRGNEHTFLMHVAGPGEPARVLYWYRTAPGVRLGRMALDHAAMHWLEEQYPDIDFDWPEILESATLTPIEIEAPLPPRKRKPRPVDVDDEPEPSPDTVAPAEAEAASDAAEAAESGPTPRGASADDGGPDLLAELMGRGIAAEVRQTHRDVAAEIETAAAAEPVRVGWRARLASADPDTWATPEAVLHGMGAFEATIAGIRSEVEAAGTTMP